MAEVAGALDAALWAGDDWQLALGVFLGVALGLFAGMLWLRVWRWLFALFGLRA